MRAMYANGECNICERQVARTADAMYANDRCDVCEQQDHNEDSEVDGNKQQPLLTTRRQYND